MPHRRLTNIKKYFLPKRILTPKPAFATISHVDWMRLYQQRPVDNIAEWCNGSTYDSDSYCLGSNPSSAAISLHGQAVKTSPSHGENWGSSPHGGATSIHRSKAAGGYFCALREPFPRHPVPRRLFHGESQEERGFRFLSPCREIFPPPDYPDGSALVPLYFPLPAAEMRPPWAFDKTFHGTVPAAHTLAMVDWRPYGL